MANTSSPAPFDDARASRIIANVRVIEVLDLLGYPWEFAADRTQQIRCPIHDDRSPSARYYHDQQTVYCFTCGKSWDVIGLIAAKHSMSRDAALAYLEDEFPTSATAETLVQRLRVQLTTPGAPDYSALFGDAERRLIARRRTLGLDVYSKRLLALDITQYQLTQGELEASAVQAILVRFLS